jgi:hypothetical protein
MPMLLADYHADKCTHCHKVEALTDVEQVATADWDLAVLTTEQPNSPDIGPMQGEEESGLCTRLKGISERIPTYKRVTGLNVDLSLAGSLERHWGQKTFQTILP